MTGSLLDHIPDAQAPTPPDGPNPIASYSGRFTIAPPADAEATYKGWTVWYDWGDFEHGICYRETKWRARSRSGELIEPPHGSVGDLEWLKGEIDRRTDGGG